MNARQKVPFIARFLPYLTIGLMIVLFIIGMIVFSYVLIIGAFIGFILFAISYIRVKFFGKKYPATYNQRPDTSQSTKTTGRTIEYEKEKNEE